MKGKAFRLCIMAVIMTVAGASISWGLQVTLTADNTAVITNPSDETEVRVLLKYDLPSCIASSRIIHAQLTGHVEAARDPGEVAVEMEAVPLSVGWSPGSVSWSVPWDTAGGDVDGSLSRSFLVGDGRSTIRIDATHLVRQWATGERDNFGVMLRTSDGFAGAFVLPAGEGGAGPAEAPTLRVWYLP